MPAFRSISSQRMCTALHGNCATVQGNSRTPPPQTLHSLPCMGPCCCAERLQVLQQGLFMSMLLHHSARRCLGVADCRLVRSILTGMTWPLLLCRARASSGHTSSASTSA